MVGWIVFWIRMVSFAQGMFRIGGFGLKNFFFVILMSVFFGMDTGLVRMPIRMVCLVRMPIRMVLPGQDANQDGCPARIFGMA
jgi:hypothetical protein